MPGGQGPGALLQAKETYIFWGRHVLHGPCTLRAEGQSITSDIPVWCWPCPSITRLVRRGWTAALTWGRAARRHRHSASNTSSIPADCCPGSPLGLRLLAKDGSLCSLSVWKEGGEGEYRTWSPAVGEGGSVGRPSLQRGKKGGSAGSSQRPRQPAVS